MSGKAPTSAVSPPINAGGDCPTGEHGAGFIVPDDQQIVSGAPGCASQFVDSEQRTDRQRGRALGDGGQALAFVSALAVVLSVLSAVIPIAAATFVVGLVVGMVGGVLLAPMVRQGAAWLSRYLR